MTSILIGCFQISVIIAFNTLGEAKLVRVWRCPIMWLPISILYGAECGCEYTFGTLLLNWMDGSICWLFGPNWPPNSMLLSLLWATWIPGSWSCDWSINAPTTFYNSTCLAIHVLMWKGTKGQSIIACPSSQNAWK